jgi:protein SCO1/2
MRSMSDISSSRVAGVPGVRFGIAALICLLAGGVGGLLAFGTRRHSEVPAWFTPARAQPPPFRLRDQSGRPTSLADARGEIVVLTFLYSTCRQLCPAQAAEIRDAVVRVGGGVQVYGVSVDPVGDTPGNVGAFLEHNGLAGAPVHFLTGTRRELAPVWERYGIVPLGATPEEVRAAAATFVAPDPKTVVAKARSTARDEYGLQHAEGYGPGAQPVPRAAHNPYPSSLDGRYRGWPRHGGYQSFEHSAYVMLIDKHGRQRVGFPFEQLNPKLLEQDMRVLLAER